MPQIIKPNKILVFKVGAIGDVLMATPFLRQLRRNFPNARIDFLVGKAASLALNGNRNIDGTLTFNEAAFFRKNPVAWLSMVSRVRKAKYDAVFVLDKHRAFNATSFLFGIPERIGFDRMGREGSFLTRKTYFSGKKHDVQYYLDLLEAAGYRTDRKDTFLDMAVPKADKEYASAVWKRKGFAGKKVICVAPGGANNPGQKISLKLWPKERYAEIVGALAGRGNPIILVGDSNDEEIAKYIVNRCKSKNAAKTAKIINLAGKATLQQTAALMKRSCLVVCNDTGPMHVASAVGTRAVALFGPTDPKRFAPLNRGSVSVFKKAKGCPCNDIYGNFRCGVDCISLIKTEDVMNAITKAEKAERGKK